MTEHECEEHLYAVDEFELYKCSMCGAYFVRDIEGNYIRQSEESLTIRRKAFDSLGLSSEVS